MNSPARPEVGKERYLSNSKGIGGKLRKKPEDFKVDEIISNNEKSHWIWAKENKHGKHSIVRITAKNWDTHVLVKELAKELEIGQKAIVAIRPENIVCSEKKNEGGNSIEARVIERIFKGSYTEFKLAVGNEKVVELKLSMDGRHAESIVDEKLWVTFEPSFLSVMLS